MTRFLLRRLLPALPLVALAGGVALAQPGQFPPPRPGLPTVPAPADKDDVEVLARGPIHEAFASSAEMPAGGPVVDKRPPDAVEELPPDQKPDGDNVQWMPGYWHFDEERKDFIWISGFWRDAPPGRVWVPGGWQEVRNGFQWVSGFWNVPAPGAQPGVAPQAQLEYLPPPPATLETGPTLVSPGDDYFYTPGSWVYRVNRYVWRPGFWVAHRPNWVWVPDQYRWTPCGFVFVPGYWDVPLERRGVLFAPVFFRPAVVLRPRFVYTPVYAVPAPCLHTSLFVRTGYSGYYFGDYFEQRYATAGFSSWAVGIRGSNFAVTVSGGRGFAYDPLWSYYSVAYRREPAWQQNIGAVYTGRFNGTVARPPRTLVQQNTIINNTTVNNNTTIINNNSNNTTTSPAAAAQVTMLAPLADLKKASPTVALKPVAVEDRAKEQQAAKELRQVAVERRKAETQLVARGQVPVKADDKPQQVKVDMAKTAVARAQMPTAKEKTPPPAPAPVMKKPDAPAGPPTGVKPGDKPNIPAVPPKNDPPKGPPAKNDPPKPGDPPKKDPPKGPVTPPTMPPTGPKPGDPKPPVNPPKPGDPPKDPTTPPAVPPKVDPPKGPTIPPGTPPVGPKPSDPPKSPPASPPKNDPPKGPTLPPKVDPPKGPTLPPVGPKPKDPPKVDPPKGPTIPPAVPPKNDPPKAPPPKVDPPKQQPPAAPPPKIDPPKPPVSNPPPKPPASPPPAAPPKIDPPKSNPPQGPGVPTRPMRGDDKKDDRKK